MEVTFGRESHPSREGPPATLITHYQCHHPEHTIHVHSVLSVPSFYTLWTNIKTISTIVRPPSQSNYNHPSSTSGPTPSLDILLLLFFYFFSSSSSSSYSLCFIHHLCEVEPNLQAQRARLATAPLRAGLINYPPRQPDGIAGAHRMTDPEPCGQPGAACSGPLSPSLTPFLFYSTRVSVRYDPQSDTSEPVTEQSLLGKA